MTLQRTAARTVLGASPASAREARAFVAQRCLDAGVDEDTCDTAQLLASELATNAVLHGRSDVRLAVVVDEASVRVEVGDDNSRHPEVMAGDDAALDGRGLAIVDALSSAWGVRDDVLGKTIWFTLDRA